MTWTVGRGPQNGSVSITTTTPVVDPPAPTGMTPPAGAVLNDDLTLLSAWYQQNGSNLTQLAAPTVGPGGDPILRNTLVDGQRNADIPDGTDVERSDGSYVGVPVGSVRWMIWWMRVNELPANLGDGGWHMLGPCEIHGNTLPQAPVQPLIGAANQNIALRGRHCFDISAGSATPAPVDAAPVDIGNWHQWKFGIFYTQSSSGWAEVWRDDVRVIRKDGPTTGEASSGYWKWANYRGSGMTGRSQYDISGVRVYRVGAL